MIDEEDIPCDCSEHPEHGRVLKQTREIEGMIAERQYIRQLVLGKSSDPEIDAEVDREMRRAYRSGESTGRGQTHAYYHRR